jgi:phosphoglycerate dehydrogenase-like enzyme
VIASVPSAALAEAAGEVEGVEYVVWDGAGPPPRADIELVVLANARGVHDDATAELALGLTIASLRGIDRAVREHGHWYAGGEPRSLADSHVTVLGYGSIGRALATRLLACRAVVTAVATSRRDDDLVGTVVTAADVDWAAQQVVVVVLPLSEATRHVVDATFLARLSDGALVVNVGRGPLVDTSAAVAEAGRLRFALDVTDPEPLPDGHPLWSAPGVLITPHVSGGTTAMLPRMAALLRDQLTRYVAAEPLRNLVVS